MMPDQPAILIRADAGPRHGFGHVMRCLALAQAAADAGCSVAWAIAECPEGARARLATEGIVPIAIEALPGSPEDAVATVAAARHAQASSIILDGYHFTPDYQDLLTSANARVLYLDDNGIFPRYPAQLILNQNPYAATKLYPGKADEDLLLGPPYLLLRREFRQTHARHEDDVVPSDSRRIIVTFGGCDGAGWTDRAISALSTVTAHRLHITVVIGAGNARREAIAKAAAASPHHVSLVANPPDMATLMRHADLVVSAAGTTVWELATLGMPAVILPVADNQLRIAETMDALGVVQSLGWHEQATEADLAAAVGALLDDEPRRKAMATAGRHLVDGQGADRVIRALRGDPGNVELRPATLADVTALWNLANQPDVRRNCFSPEPIPLVGHIRWFAARLASPDTCLNVIVRNGRLLGQIRHDRRPDGQTADIGIAVAPAGRGQGLGRRLIMETATLACRELAVSVLHAIVYADNFPSLELFRRCGFAMVGTESRDGRDVVHFNWRPECP
jgi:UDP-2,4-diacetamido-2,4,6-trideoxy-beta-L-altropyranose hydrolase